MELERRWICVRSLIEVLLYFAHCHILYTNSCNSQKKNVANMRKRRQHIQKDKINNGLPIFVHICAYLCTYLAKSMHGCTFYICLQADWSSPWEKFSSIFNGLAIHFIWVQWLQFQQWNTNEWPTRKKGQLRKSKEVNQQLFAGTCAV